MKKHPKKTALAIALMIVCLPAYFWLKELRYKSWVSGGKAQVEMVSRIFASYHQEWGEYPHDPLAARAGLDLPEYPIYLETKDVPEELVKILGLEKMPEITKNFYPLVLLVHPENEEFQSAWAFDSTGKRELIRLR